ncbi:MAG TPA: SOS response-associated peptidase family protein [Trinickia sp.]|jgi:putative SOS response-associated peptidase YedK|uniref:SOS response-associated peptidase n=1 Tax=Trinickia sp. TaxID=2571163 RepID=UPI002C0A770B|nr:SOS response-associated peptidase family protein [Trinickia sp.]HTI18246.1 SOS response-associated peptidase family protein [Trinickia sp.]
MAMCTSYKVGRDIDFGSLFDVEATGEWQEEIYKDYVAPIVMHDMTGARVFRLATFGMVPRKRIARGVKVFDTMNCRMETVATKRSFSDAWRAGQVCLIPCTAFYEPNYESGKAVRWSIGMADAQPFAIAGLWRTWDEEEGVAISFTMLTLNADPHPLLSRFHRPGAEKRGVVIVPPTQYEAWLTCRDAEIARTFLQLTPADQMAACAAPLPPRTAAPAGADLFELTPPNNGRS